MEIKTLEIIQHVRNEIHFGDVNQLKCNWNKIWRRVRKFFRLNEIKTNLIIWVTFSSGVNSKAIL